MDLRLDTSLLGLVLQNLDGRSLVLFGRAAPWCAARTKDRNDDGFGSRLWRHLCDRYSYRQAGTRTRNRVPWADVYYANICVECADPGTVHINDRALAWPNGRFALCRPCLANDTLWRIAARPEINQDATKLKHALFRIATVARELGHSSRRQRRRRVSLRVSLDDAEPSSES